MCDMELRFDYKQSEVGRCWPVERGSSHSWHWVVSISMSERFFIMASILKQLVVPKGRNSSTGQELDSDSDPKREAEADFLPQSPSPEAEYDKLLVRKKHISLLHVLHLEIEVKSTCV